jgi:hypothetical protein
MIRPPNAPSAQPSIVVKRQGRPSLETQAQAEARNLKRIDNLINREPEIAVAVEACCPDAPCDLPICALCSRRFRFPFIRELVRIAKSCGGQGEIATIDMGTVVAGSLAAATLERLRDRLRKQLQRNGFAGSILIGKIEAGWSNKRKTWIVHAHLLAIGVPDEAWAKLRAALRNSESAIPVKVQSLRDVERQVSYIIKFTTYHRPLDRDGGGRSRAVPLPLARLAELAAWWTRYRFGDFVFLFGARRFGGRVVVDPGSREGAR